MAKSPSRALAQLFGVYHNVTYYARELSVFQERGIDEFWHGYMAFRAAPLGRVNADVVTAAFYNFAPSLVEAAVPSVWETVTPAEAIQLRNDAITTSLSAVYQSDPCDETMVDVAETIFDAMTPMPAAGRALFASYRALAKPDDAVLRLWHAATLWREFRGDGHNIVLASEGIDGVECHVLLAGRGIGSREIIEKIRGWDRASWDGALERLGGRGLVDADGALTDSGTALRRHIENRTDELAAAPLDAIGPDRSTSLIEQLGPIVARLVESGVVPDRWPPPTTTRPMST
jgi:hypothetical protein